MEQAINIVALDSFVLFPIQSLMASSSSYQCRAALFGTQQSMEKNEHRKQLYLMNFFKDINQLTVSWAQ